jgi:glycosyltransferase involved in cell wall biosynthesis
MRLVCILNAPIPYHTPVLNELAALADVHVLYMSRDDRVNRFADVWGTEPRFDHSYYWSTTLKWDALDLRAQVSAGVSRRLTSLDPDAIMVLSWHPIVFEPIVWSRVTGRAAVMWAESTSFSGLLRGAASTSLRRTLVRKVDAFVSNGSQASAYLRTLGVPDGRIVQSCLPTGVGAINLLVDQQPAHDGPVRFLFVGRLIDRKRPIELIERFAEVRVALPHATLDVVGKGPLEEDTRRAAAQVPGVTVLGHREGADLAEIYQRSDVLVLPAAREVWGLVVNEALSHGLYVVATDEVGAAFDLLDDTSGTMIPAHDLDQLAPTLINLAAHLDRSESARSQRAAGIAAGCGPERFARDVMRAAQLAVDLRTRPSVTTRPHSLVGETGQSKRIVAEESRWDAIASETLGTGASLLAVSRWIGDSRVYENGDRVALIRSRDVRTWSGANPLASERDVLQELGVDAEHRSMNGVEALIMPRFDGQTLDRLVHQIGRRQRLAIVRETARSLRKIHRRGVAHRDVRSDNVLLAEGGSPRLIDFDQAVRGGRVSVALADWVGVSPHGLSPNPFWKFALFAMEPRAQSLARRVRTKLDGRHPAWLSPPSDDRELQLLAEAWRIARGSSANAPGQGIAYYAFTYKGWHFPGERPWYLRWEPIRRAVDFDGKRIVELGANMGLFSSFALIHGATKSVGLDHDPAILDAARLVAQALGVTPEFHAVDLVSDQDWERPLQGADLVSCTSVLHWLPSRDRVSEFLAQQPELLYEGHDTLEEEKRFLADLGFSRVDVLTETERGRHLFHATKS